jgi:DNA polymerase IV
MHYFLFLRLEGFYSRALLLSDRMLAEKALVVHRDKRVLDLNSIASGRQVYRGMALSEAKAILQDAAFVAWEEEPYRSAQVDWLNLCTDISDVIEPFEQHSAWIDISLQTDADALVAKLQSQILEQFGLTSTIGSGPSKWLAKLASQFPNREFHSLRTRFLTPIEPQHRSRLEFLGYATIGEVAQVPLSVLRSQFGEAATHIRMCARGGYFEPVEAIYPPNSISARIPVEGDIDDLQVLDLFLRALASILSEKLTKEDKQGKEVVVTLEHEGFRTTVLRRKFTKPVQNFASALASLRLLLTPPPEESIVSIRVRIENVTESKRVQQELTGRTTSGDRSRGAMAAFQHIKTVFGDSAIQTGNELVEPRRKQVLRAWKDVTGWI